MIMSLKIGSHVSIAEGLLGAAKEAASYGASTFMIYTGAPQNTRRTALSNLKIEEGHAFMKEQGIHDIVVHAPYIINLASYKPHIYDLAISFLSSEMERTQALGANYIVLHPGSYTDKDANYGIERIAEGLNQIVNPDTDLWVCLETMAGKGTEIGRNFEELAKIIDKVKYNEKIGVCFDTCHTHDSGYDIIDHFDEVMENFDQVIGLDRLKVFHINGSLNPRGAQKDRHANINADETNPRGKDHIGLDALYRIVHHPVAQDKPLILETPWLDSSTNLYAQEIAMLREDRS